MNQKITPEDYKDQLNRRLQDGVLEKIKNLRAEMKRNFWGSRYEGIIDNIIIAAMAGQPVLLIGKPGFAKSLIMTTFFSLLGLNKTYQDENGQIRAGKKYFQYLLHSFTMPDEILGVIKIGKFIEENRFIREREGSLNDPSVKAAFLDEVFNANSTILNTLLSIINEKEFYEGGVAYKSSLFIIAGAANRVPREPELHAFFDRFPVRLLVDLDLNEKVTQDEYNERISIPGKNIITNDEDNENSEAEEESCVLIPEEDHVFFRIIDQGIENLKRHSYSIKGVRYDRYLTGENTMPDVEDFELVHNYILSNYTPANGKTFEGNAKKAMAKLVEGLNETDACTINGRNIVKLYMLSAASAIFRTAIEGTGDEGFELPKITVQDLSVFRNIWNSDKEEIVSMHIRAVDNILEEFYSNYKRSNG